MNTEPQKPAQDAERAAELDTSKTGRTAGLFLETMRPFPTPVLIKAMNRLVVGVDYRGSTKKKLAIAWANSAAFGNAARESLDGISLPYLIQTCVEIQATLQMRPKKVRHDSLSHCVDFVKRDSFLEGMECAAKLLSDLGCPNAAIIIREEILRRRKGLL